MATYRAAQPHGIVSPISTINTPHTTYTTYPPSSNNIQQPQQSFTPLSPPTNPSIPSSSTSTSFRNAAHLTQKQNNHSNPWNTPAPHFHPTTTTHVPVTTAPQGNHGVNMTEKSLSSMDTTHTSVSNHLDRSNTLTPSNPSASSYITATSEPMRHARTTLENLKRQHHQDRSRVVATFNDLQSITSQFDVTLEIPEVVVVGMQSDGKSSFIEALLGFQFNIVDTGIGTRRPLIIQMMYDANQLTPSCRFQKDELENHPPWVDQHRYDDLNTNDPTTSTTNLSSKHQEQYRSSSSTHDQFEALFEQQEVPVSQLCHEVTRRTNLVPARDMVSDKPIVLRVKYHKCANLTIYDTPGFRLGGDEQLKSRIQDMVIRLITPQHRIIVCLEQSTVEWANSNSRPMVQRVDRHFERTILVSTKFDNRLKELQDAPSANKYLAGDHPAMSSLSTLDRQFHTSTSYQSQLTHHQPSSSKTNNLNEFNDLNNVHDDTVVNPSLHNTHNHNTTLPSSSSSSSSRTKNPTHTPKTQTQIPYFISLPIRRGLDPQMFEDEMSACQLRDLNQLYELGFDHQRFETHIGIYYLRTHLEQCVYERYMKTITPTLQAIDLKLERICSDIANLQAEIESVDFDLQRRRVWVFIQKFASSVSMLLHGTIDVNTNEFGETQTQELQHCQHLPHWGLKLALPINSHHTNETHVDVHENLNDNHDIASQNSVELYPEQDTLHSHLSKRHHNNMHREKMMMHDDEEVDMDESMAQQISALKLYGGAQISRLLADYEHHLVSLEMPPISQDELACAAGIHFNGFKNATLSSLQSPQSSSLLSCISVENLQNIANTKVVQHVKPMMTMLTERLRHVVRRIFDTAYAYTMDKDRRIAPPRRHTIPSPPFNTSTLPSHETSTITTNTTVTPLTTTLDPSSSSRLSDINAGWDKTTVDINQHNALFVMPSYTRNHLDITTLEKHTKFNTSFKSIFTEFENIILHRFECALHEALLKITSFNNNGSVSMIHGHSITTTASSPPSSSTTCLSLTNAHPSRQRWIPSSYDESSMDHITTHTMNTQAHAYEHFKRSAMMISQLTFAGVETDLIHPLMTQVLPHFINAFSRLDLNHFESLFSDNLPLLKQELQKQTALQTELQHIRQRFLDLVAQARH